MEGMGLTAEDISQLGAMAANAGSTYTKGQCTTTLIWLELGEQHDPATKYTLDQIRMWFYLINMSENSLVHVAKMWWKAKRHINVGNPEWAKVRGPMGATIALLGEIGWDPISPLKWAHPIGEKWQFHTNVSQSIFIREMREWMAAMAWAKASQHHNGTGLERGADLSVAKRHVMVLRKLGRLSQASLLVTITAGGIWSQVRKRQAGMEDIDTLCPWCKEQDQDDLHLLWTCPKLLTSDSPAIRNTNYLIGRAYDAHQAVPCYWLRGITPAWWTNRGFSQNNIYNVGDDPLTSFDTTKGVYFDGSGGDHNQDPRVRVVGWAWIQVMDIPRDQVRPLLNTDAIGMHGTMEGPQTVPRAELNCLLQFTRFLAKAAHEPTTINCYTDNQAVFDGYKKGPKIGHGSLDDLWEELWITWKEVYNKGWIILLHKVKSHTGIPDIGVTIRAEHRTGNALADHWAGEAAKRHNISQDDANIKGLIDATAWKIQTRLIAVCQSYLVHGKSNKEVKPAITLEQRTIQLLEFMGHIPCPHGANWAPEWGAAAPPHPLAFIVGGSAPHTLQNVGLRPPWDPRGPIGPKLSGYPKPR
jgi:hypothetical protein